MTDYLRLGIENKTKQKTATNKSDQVDISRPAVQMGTGGGGGGRGACYCRLTDSSACT